MLTPYVPQPPELLNAGNELLDMVAQRMRPTGRLLSLPAPEPDVALLAAVVEYVRQVSTYLDETTTLPVCPACESSGRHKEDCELGGLDLNGGVNDAHP